MPETVEPAAASAAKASTWSAGCIGARITFSASEISVSEASAGTSAAGDREIGGDLAFGGEFDEGLVAPAAGDDGEPVVGALDRADDEVGEDAEVGDRGLELGEGLQAGVGLADVRRGNLEPVEGDHSDSLFGLRFCGAHARLLGTWVPAPNGTAIPPDASPEKEPDGLFGKRRRGRAGTGGSERGTGMCERRWCDAGGDRDAEGEETRELRWAFAGGEESGYCSACR